MADEINDSDLIVKWAIEGAKHGDCGRMCSDCAFKKGTEANADEYVAAMAAQCVAYDMAKFNCHTTDLKFIDKPCAGYLYAKQYFEKRYGKNDDSH